MKTCKTAFHVTCGFQNGLEMKTVLDENDEADGVKLKVRCTREKLCILYTCCEYT